MAATAAATASITTLRARSIPPLHLSSTLRLRLRCRVLSASLTVQAPDMPAAVSHRRGSAALEFVKYHGVGNDFILVDNRDSMDPKISPDQAVRLCDRHFGIGADGVIFVMPGVNGTDYSMRIFNSDGSEPEMCGNGVRCFARFVSQLENLRETESFTIHTGAGLIIPQFQNDGKKTFMTVFDDHDFDFHVSQVFLWYHARKLNQVNVLNFHLLYLQRRPKCCRRYH